MLYKSTYLRKIREIQCLLQTGEVKGVKKIEPGQLNRKERFCSRLTSLGIETIITEGKVDVNSVVTKGKRVFKC